MHVWFWAYLLLVQYNIKLIEFNMTICQKTHFIGDPVKWFLVGDGDSEGARKPVIHIAVGVHCPQTGLQGGEWTDEAKGRWTLVPSHHRGQEPHRPNTQVITWLLKATIDF